MNKDKRELAAFLKEVSGWDWYDFIKAESDPKYTTRQSIVFALIRAAAMEDLRAITTSLNRLDGKMEVPIQVITPKIYFLYPNATEVAHIIEGETLEKVEIGPSKKITIMAEYEVEEEMPSQSFRDTMEKMATRSRSLPKQIIDCQEQWEAFAHNRGQAPEQTVKVSSVVAARLLKMAQNRDMKALDEVFNQLDGKLVETVRVVGEDMYIMQFGSIAPAGSIRNEKGVYQIEAPSRMTQMWGQRLDATKKGLNNIIEEE